MPYALGGRLPDRRKAVFSEFCDDSEEKGPFPRKERRVASLQAAQLPLGRIGKVAFSDPSLHRAAGSRVACSTHGDLLCATITACHT